MNYDLKNENEDYSIIFYSKDKTAYRLVKDKLRDTPRSYKSIDRLVIAMQDIGYKSNYTIVFNHEYE